MWNLKKAIQMNLFTKQKQTQETQKQTHGVKWEWGEERIN